MPHPKAAHVLFGLTVVSALAGCTEDPPDDHGTINIMFDRSDANIDPFPGTYEVVLQVAYIDDCLVPFYTETNPGYKKDGPDGAPIFEEWMERLCDPSESFNDRGIDCEVVDILQVENQATQTLSLRVIYRILDQDMTQRELALGPLPTEALAGCTPRVQLTGASANGLDTEGNGVWQIDSLPSPPTAATNQGAPMILEIRRL